MRKRAKAAFLFSLRMFAPSVSGFLISLLVVHIFSSELWGSVSNISLWVYLFTGIASWGSKDHLLRQFSREPAGIRQAFTGSVLTRSLLLPLLAAGLYFTSGPNITIWWYCIIWLAARFLYNSCEPLVIYNRKFGQVAVIEIAGALLAAGLLAFTGHIDTAGIIGFLMLADVLRCVLIMLLFSGNFTFRVKPLINVRYLIAALPFFLIGMAGLMQSRLEQLIVNTFLADGEKAFCQVYMNLLLMAMSIPALIITPVTKELYRSGTATFSRIRNRMIRFGIAAAPISGIMVWAVVRYVYGFGAGLSILFAGVLFCVPVYLYIPAMVKAYKHGLQTYIMILIACCLVAGTISGLLMIPVWKTTGAIYNAAFTQWLMLLMLMIRNKKTDATLNNTEAEVIHIMEPDR